MNNSLLKIKNSPVWVKFKKFFNEHKQELTEKGLPGYKLEQFAKNLSSKEKEYIEEFLNELYSANYLNIDSKKRIFIEEKAQKELF